MPLLLRLALFLLSMCASVQVTVTRQEHLPDPEPDPEPQPDPELHDSLDYLDDDSFANWVDFLEYCWELDPGRHDYNRHTS